MEFPAVGYRANHSDGLLYGAGVYGLYWASVAYDSGSAYNLYFGSGNLSVVSNHKQDGRSVRCVR
ncbi:MAG: DUF1566 domain-containing protein [Rikenellaceae bacterium]|nr:DUF1566 domain-containing protein [Rikenellaceae bacterium]